jgi:fused signal recognition particle receptor
MKLFKKKKKEKPEKGDADIDTAIPQEPDSVKESQLTADLSAKEEICSVDHSGSERDDAEAEGATNKRGFFARFRRRSKQGTSESSEETHEGPETTTEKEYAQEEIVEAVQEVAASGEEASESGVPTGEQKKGFWEKFVKREPVTEEETGADTSLQAPKGEEAEKAAEPAEEEGEEEPGKEKKGFFKKLRTGLTKTRKAFVTRVDELLLGKKEIDEELLEELEEILITSDIGVHTSMRLIESVRERVERKDLNSPEELRQALQSEIRSFLQVEAPQATATAHKPHVIMVVGVNGVGKTTTIGKLAARYKKEGKQVLLVAADTFRAAAVEQLQIWSERIDCNLVKHTGKSDPSAVAYDGIQAAKSRDADMVIIDTAGRLHTKANLMEELKKVRRTIAGQLSGAPHEILLVLDATTGQNAISQAELFDEALELTGIALTKLDGTAKGGIVVGICERLRVPLKYIGIGEKVDDLQTFDADEFIQALF